MIIRMLVLILTLALGLPSVAFAGHGGKSCGGSQGSSCDKKGGHGGGHGDKGMDLPDLDEKFFMKAHFYLAHREILGLTEEQIMSIMDRKMELMRASVEMKAKKSTAMIDVYREMMKPNPNADQMKSLIDNKIEAKRQFSYAALDALRAVQSVLTEEQRQKAKQLYWSDKFGSCWHPAKPAVEKTEAPAPLEAEVPVSAPAPAPAEEAPAQS